MERQPEAVCLDCDRRIHPRETRPVPPDTRANPAGLHAPKRSQTKVQLILGHYTRVTGAAVGSPATSGREMRIRVRTRVSLRAVSSDSSTGRTAEVLSFKPFPSEWVLISRRQRRLCLAKLAGYGPGR